MSHGRRWDRAVRGLAVVAALGLALGVGLREADAQDAGPNQGAITLSAGVDFTTQYWFRGLAQENQGLIAQPWIDLGFGLYEGDGALNSIDLNVGIWNSWHGTNPTGTGGAGSDPELWYEADLYGGVSFTVYNDWTLGLVYTAYTSPNNTFGTTEEIAGSIAYNDAQFWADLGVEMPGFEGLQPAVTIAGELEGGADGVDEGIYFELALSPSLLILDNSDYPITLTIPMTLGFGDEYYEDGTDDDAFGYFDVGADFSMPLTFMSSDYGAWEVYAGVHVIILGDTASNIAGAAVTEGDDAEIYGVAGISFTY
jgi:hypothetical protein